MEQLDLAQQILSVANDNWEAIGEELGGLNDDEAYDFIYKNGNIWKKTEKLAEFYVTKIENLLKTPYHFWITEWFTLKCLDKDYGTTESKVFDVYRSIMNVK